MTRQFDPRFLLRRAALIAFASLILWTLPAQGAGDNLPRPISDAEHAAAEAVLAFLETGPNAIWTRLAPDSPLRSQESRRALDEIAVRLGSAEGSTWHLRTPGRAFERQTDVALFTVEFASGIDDVILMHMTEHAEGWMIHQIRCGVDPRMPRDSIEEELLELYKSTPGAGAGAGPRFTVPMTTPPTALLVALLVLSAVAVWTVRRRRMAASLLLATCLVTSGCQWLSSGEKPATSQPFVELDTQNLAPLLPLRRALTGGRSSGSAEQAEKQEEIAALVKQLVGILDVGNPKSVAAYAWNAQMLSVAGNVGAASKILEAIPQPDDLPLVALLRARTAAAQSEQAAIKLYQLARRIGPDHDGLALEAAHGLGNLGEEDEMESHVRAQVWMGSRAAEGFYYAAQFEALLDQMDKAEKLFQAGWEREPISRGDLLSQPVLAYIGIRPANFSLFQFGEAHEPALGPTRQAQRPLTLPEGATSRILGEHLVIQLGDKRLDVDGGGDLRPDGTVVESAQERSDREASEALARFDELVNSLAQGQIRPSNRRASVALAESLAQREQWSDLIRLTEPLAAQPESAPPDLIKLRALALMRAEQRASATNLLIGLAKNDIANRRRDPITFYQLGEMLIELGEYDLALRAMERASALTALDFTGQRKKQIELMKELKDASQTVDSKYFRMVYPTSLGEKYPRQLTWVLEAEWDRIRKWIPAPANSPRVEINLYPWNKFTEAYARAGGEVGGLYDGVVRIPVLNFESFQPELLTIYSHEVAHAMIDIVSGGKAPSWFHEGLASHIEMRQRSLNPMPDMHKAGRDLSFTLLPPIFESWSEPQMVELAYTNAGWTLHYIETAKGIAGIHKMLDAFRRGDDTAGAIRRVFGQSLEEFDRSFRSWAINDAPQIWQTEMVAYHEMFDRLVQRDAMDPVGATDQPASATVLRSGNIRTRAGELKKDMHKWHGEYTRASRPVKVALANSLPLLQGKTEGDVQAACKDLRAQLDFLLGSPTALRAPDAEVQSNLTRAYRAFSDMTQHCRDREWQKMRQKMQLAVEHLGKTKSLMETYELAP